MILGVDVGGTFTDFVLSDESGRVHVHKLLTTASDPSLAILQGITDLQIGLDTIVVHGTTVATNALLERRGARTALITTAGFGDILEIGRQARPDLYALHPSRPDPLVPAGWRFELAERVDRQGRVVIPLIPEEVDGIIEQIKRERIDSAAVCFLFSFLNPAHERLVRDRIRSQSGLDQLFVSLSSDIVPEYREYERTATVVINAYVAPLVGRYLGKLQARLGGRRLRIMQSNGGILSAKSAAASAARTALSGPAGGVVGAFELARQAGLDQVITFDMGGTSTDVSLCPGHIEETIEGTLAGMPLRLPTIDIHTVGAGGGSLAQVDAGGALRVGPESAGADPGPVCYGNSQALQVTVTDANLLLGRLDTAHFLGGRMHLDLARPRVLMQALADGLYQNRPSAETAAWGIIRVANSNMERAIRQISIERGHDPRRFTLVAFGGAGPLHACELAEALHIPRVLIPPHPGVLSALGMILADVTKDYSQTVMLRAADVDGPRLTQLFVPLQQRARTELLQEGLAESDLAFWPAVDMRYAGQSYELTIPLVSTWEVTLDHFHATHEQRFSHAHPGEAVEVVTLRLKAVGRTAKPKFARDFSGDSDPRPAQIGVKPVHFAATGTSQASYVVPAALYERELLRTGHLIVGAAVIFQLDATTLIPPGWSARVDDWRNLIVEKRGR